MSASNDEKATPSPKVDEPPLRAHTIFSERKKIFCILTCTSMTFLGAMASNMYFPALGPLAESLSVSSSDINYTITSFKLVQALAPLLIAPATDNQGRRPAFLWCLVIFLGSNIGLALQGNYVALLLLRCVQSLGCSSASVVSSAAIADIVTRGERGKYMIYSSLGLNVGMATGPIIGGILTQFWGWRSTFWYMVVLSGILLIIIVFWLPETCRTIVGDGSIPPPQRWNRNISELLRPTHSGPINHDTLGTFKRRPGMLNTLKILRDRHIALLATCSALYAWGFTIVFATLPAVMERKYGFNPLQVGLCYIPFAVGGLTARWTAGSLVDWNFKRHAHRVGLETEKNHQSPLRKIPLEKARLQLLLPFLYFSSIIMVAYGWVMKYPIHLSAPMILLFFLGNTTSGVTSILSTLMIDLHVNQPGSVLAALNAFKNLSGAAAAAAAVPMVDHLGFGWSGVIVAGLWILVSPGLWLVYFRGHAWRQASGE